MKATAASGHPRVLWVSLAEEMSGAEHSLMEVLRFTRCTVATAAPPGAFANRLTELGWAPTLLPMWRPRDRQGPGEYFRALPGLLRLRQHLVAAVRAAEVEVLVGNGLRAGLAASLASTGLPVVWAIRDNLPSGPVSVLARALCRHAAVVGNSRYVADQCGRAFGIGARAQAIYPGVQWPDPDPVLRAELGIGRDIPVIGVVGQVAPWKRQHDAIAAARVLRRSLPDLRLVIVGSAKFRWENRDYLRSLEEAAAQDRGRTVLLGERRDLARLYPDMDLLLVPSDREPFGRVAAEALGYGIPVVASAAGGLPEIVSDPLRGRLVPVGDVGQLATAAGELLARRHRVPTAEMLAVRRTFAAESAAKRWDGLLEELAKGGGAGCVA